MSTESELDIFALDERLRGVRTELSGLSETHQIAFAATCCERLLGYYRKLTEFLGIDDHNAFREILDRIWQHVAIDRLNEHESQELLQRCEALSLGDDNCCAEWDAAVDAVGALWLTATACRGDTTNQVTKACGNLMNRTFQQLTDQVLGRSYSLSPEESQAIQAKIRSHPAMKREVKWQEKQIELLRSSPALTPQVISELRQDPT